MDQQTIEELERHHKVFDPPPHGNTFVIEPTQPIIFETWKRQLEDYRGRLAVVA